MARAKEDTLSIQSIEELQSLLSEKLYVADRGLATSIYLALKLERPLFVEGEAGVGKTEIAKVLAEILDADLIRLQCYEGIDASQAVYDWSYTRQMMHIRLAESRKEKLEEKELFGPEFLENPLLLHLFLQLVLRAKFTEKDLESIKNWLEGSYELAKSDGIIETLERRLNESNTR